MTTLGDRENNLPVKANPDGLVSLKDLIKSIDHRIERHRHFIKRHQEVIEENIDFSNIVEEYFKMILEREAKIHEMQEFMEYSLNIKR